MSCRSIFPLFARQTITGRSTIRPCVGQLLLRTLPKAYGTLALGRHNNNIENCQSTFSWSRKLGTSSKCKASQRQVQETFLDYYDPVMNEYETDNRLQELALQQFETEDPDERALLISRMIFQETLEIYKQRNATHVRRHADFIEDTLRYMKLCGVERDLECYKALIDIFPEEVMVPTNNWQVEFKHFPRQQDAALMVIEEMGLNGIVPDNEFGNLLCAVFGRDSHVVRRFRRQVYWGRKFQNANPYKLPHHLPRSHLKLAMLALNRMCPDPLSELNIFNIKEESIEEEKFIVSAQSPDQLGLINEHPEDVHLYVEGEFRTWLRDKSLMYYILRADIDPALFELPDMEKEEGENLCNFESFLDIEDKSPKAVMKHTEPSLHQQPDGAILAMCITETGSRESLINWIRCLQEKNPKLEKIPIVFKVTKQIDMLLLEDSPDGTNIAPSGQ